MASKIDYASAPSVTREMLATKIEELKSSVEQIEEGHLLDRAYGIISSISKKPYHLDIAGPLHIVPDATKPDTFIVVGPLPNPTHTVPPHVGSPSPTGLAQGTTTTVECPNCRHKLKINMSL